MNYSPPQRVLFVSYLFPPVGGVGVHRVTKFVKYLPEFGWSSSVLTVSNPSVPLIDESLLKEIPPGTIIRRASTLEPGYQLKQAVAGGASQKKRFSLMKGLKAVARRVANAALQPDSQILWHPQALKEGRKLLQDVSHDAIIATGPPFSSLLLGAKLARESGLPLILDYRDEWDISNAYWENKQQGRFANWVQSRQQAKVLKAASVILATTPSSAEAILQTAKAVGSNAKATFIYNGYDPDDYQPAKEPSAPESVSTVQLESLSTLGDLNQLEDSGDDSLATLSEVQAESIATLPDDATLRRQRRFRLAFIGTLWNLNSIQPVVTAIQRIAEQNPHLAEELELLLVGRRTEDQEAIVDQLNGLPVTVTRKSFVPHAEAIKLMQSADSLLMLNSDLPKAQRIINAKTFEYMAAKRPLFVVAPEGDVWDIVRDLPGTILCQPSDIDRITDQLALAIEQHRCGLTYDDAKWDLKRFERKQLAQQLADLLDNTVPEKNFSQFENSARPNLKETP